MVSAKAIDEYATLTTNTAESNEPPNIHPRFKAILERMVNNRIADGIYQQALGMAIECRSFDELEQAVIKNDNIQASLSMYWCLWEIC